jgi:hypothetical protein
MEDKVRLLSAQYGRLGVRKAAAKLLRDRRNEIRPLEKFVLNS